MTAPDHATKARTGASIHGFSFAQRPLFAPTADLHMVVKFQTVHEARA